ncbi:MAG: prephenate dehydratase [Thermodesulfobacteriota bacterium]
MGEETRKSTVDPELEGLRREIDAVDEQIVALINRRLTVVQQIGAIKKARGIQVVDFSREREVLNRLARINRGPLPPETLRTVYAEVMAAARKIQKPVRVAYFGPEATFTHMAAMNHFGHTTALSPFSSIADVFDEVEKKSCEYGVVPVENSIEGAVNHTLDLFSESELRICGEIYTPVEHSLLSKETRAEDVKIIYSHPQALAQCRSWLRKHLPDVNQVQVASTSEAARMARDTQGAAAVASPLAAVVYDLVVLASHIQDKAHNVTRFLVIGHDQVERTGSDKTSLLFATPHVPGALYKVLAPIAEAGVNMVKLESRPAKGKSWTYLFFVDVMGHMEDKVINEVYANMQKVCAFVKWLGSYPQGDGA